MKFQFRAAGLVATSIAPHDPRQRLLNYALLVDIGRKMDTLPAVCQAHVADVLDAKYKTFTNTFTAFTLLQNIQRWPALSTDSVVPQLPLALSKSSE